MTKAAEVVLCERNGGRIVAVTRSDGTCPALEYLDELPEEAVSAFEARFTRLLEQGRITNTQHFHKIGLKGKPAVWEMKTHDGPGRRLYMIQSGRDWITTHGCDKPPDRKVAGQGVLAREIAAELI